MNEYPDLLVESAKALVEVLAEGRLKDAEALSYNLHAAIVQRAHDERVRTMNRRVEYRVRFANQISDVMSREAAEILAEEYRFVGTANVSVEVHEIVETDWEKLPEEEANK